MHRCDQMECNPIVNVLPLGVLFPIFMVTEFHLFIIYMYLKVKLLNRQAAYSVLTIFVQMVIKCKA